MPPRRAEEIINLVRRLIDLLDKVAIDSRHTPKLYARFLQGLLDDHLQGRYNTVKTPGRDPAHVQIPYLPNLVPMDPTAVVNPPYQQPLAVFMGEQQTQPQYGGWISSAPPYLTPVAQPPQPQSQFPSPSFPFPQLPQIPQSPMDLDESILRGPNLTADFINQPGFMYTQPAAASSDGTLFSMRALDGVFWSEDGSMPGYGWTATPFSNIWNPGQRNFDNGSQPVQGSGSVFQ